MSDAEEAYLEDAAPGPAPSRLPLRFFWVLDTSGSMAGEKIGSLNHAIKEVIPALVDKAREQGHEVSVDVHVLTFSSGTKWQTQSPVPLEDFEWTDLPHGGVTDMGEAMRELAKELDVKRMPRRGVPPVLVLISDGYPTDDFEKGLAKLMAQPWAKASVRVAIAIGDDADTGVLEKFVDQPEIPVFTAHNPQDMLAYIKWAALSGFASSTARPSKGRPSASSDLDAEESTTATDPLQNNQPEPSAPDTWLW